MLFCEFCKISKNIFWQSTSGWLLLKFICEFWEVFQNISFIEHLWETAYFMYKLHFNQTVFQPANTVKNYFTGAIEAFYTRTRSSHLKAYIYLKSLKIICEEVNSLWSCEMTNCKYTKKNSVTYPPSCNTFCLHFLRTHHDYFFQRGFERVRAKFLSGNINKKYGSVTCDLPVLLWFI